MPEFFIFFSLLLRVNIGLNDLRLRLTGWHGLGRLGGGCLGCNLVLRAHDWRLWLLDLFLSLLSCGLSLHMGLLTLSDSLGTHLLLVLQELRPPLLFLLARFDGLPDHLLFFASGRVGLLLRDSGHLHHDAHLLIFSGRFLCSSGISGGLGRVYRRLALECGLLHLLGGLLLR